MTAKRVVPVRDIQFGAQFDGEKMRRLVEAIAYMGDEMRRIQEMLDGGDANTVLVKNSSKDYDAEWTAVSGGGGGGGIGGEANTGANVGSGIGVFRDKSGVVLNFRTIRGGAGISVSLVGDDIQISATTGGGGSGYPAELGHAGL